MNACVHFCVDYGAVIDEVPAHSRNERMDDFPLLERGNRQDESSVLRGLALEPGLPLLPDAEHVQPLVQLVGVCRQLLDAQGASPRASTPAALVAFRRASVLVVYDIETPLLVHARLPVRPDDRLASLQAEARRRDLLAVLVTAEVLRSLPNLSMFLRRSKSGMG